MKTQVLAPKFLTQALKRTYRSLVSTRIYRKGAKSVNELHKYWSNPKDISNLPQSYLKGEERSQFLVGLVKKYAKPDVNMLEIGCNVGRNLNYLSLAGFKELSGIEINQKAIELLREFYPDMAGHTKIFNKPVEEAIKGFKDGEFGLVFSMAVLEHIHAESEWVFPEIVRITKNFLITIEDESGSSWKHFPRNYKKVFTTLGMEQVEEINCSGMEGLGNSFFARIFKKVQ